MSVGAEKEGLHTSYVLRKHGVARASGAANAQAGTNLENQWSIKNNYHLLCRDLGDQVAVSQVVDFNVLYVVAVGNIHLAIDPASRGSAGRGHVRSGRSRRGRGLLWLVDGRHVDVLDAFAGLQLRGDPSSSGSW
jgi:hypothetical protein